MTRLINCINRMREAGFIKIEVKNLSGFWVALREPLTKDHFEARIPTQEIPRVEDWGSFCRELGRMGFCIQFHSKLYNMWVSCGKDDDFRNADRFRFRILEQTIPLGDNMHEETKPYPREEIPHRELQIQWHEDMLHHLRTGEPMREWEYKGKDDENWYSYEGGEPNWCVDNRYRRKPRTVRYWHCVTEYDGMYVLIRSFEGVDSLQKIVDQNKSRNSTTKFSPIIETTVELED